MSRLFLGIEIGGTKLQFGVGTGADSSLVALRRQHVDRAGGAEGIRQVLAQIARDLIEQHPVARIGIGFGGPVDVDSGRSLRSFQIDGWDDFPLCDWCERTLHRPAVIENDSNLAGLAEAKLGAGRNARVVFYSNVGSGIGGALIIDGKLFSGGSGVAVAEIGHLRPGTGALEPSQTVESLASGWGIAHRVQMQLSNASAVRGDAANQLLTLCGGDPRELTTRMVAEALAQGNSLATAVFDEAIQTYGWALAQVVTILSPNTLVIGGGVPQLGTLLFLDPLRAQVERYIMPSLRGTYQLLPAGLGEEVVVHGALALAADVS